MTFNAQKKCIAKKYIKEFPHLIRYLKLIDQNIQRLEEEMHIHQKEKRFYRKKVWTRIKYLSQDLTPREKTVLEERFKNRATLEVIARKFDATRERIRQIEIRALNKINLLTK